MKPKRTTPKRKGNYKPGPGRPPGRKNNKTLALEEAMREASAAIVDNEIKNEFNGDAHAFIRAVYQDPNVPLEIRLQAATRALRVEKPALSSTKATVDDKSGLADRLEAARLRVRSR